MMVVNSDKMIIWCLHSQTYNVVVFIYLIIIITNQWSICSIQVNLRSWMCKYVIIFILPYSRNFLD
ncbi:hypothetical protein UFO1_2010 [Pelosinus sp. UFO1]|nr:hypothetical protein UFO1_2010 [Pelosinus sp. UFO1]